MGETLAWWLSVELLGLAALPLAVHAFRFLPDRGYAFCRPLGLLLVSYALWITATFGLLRNHRSTIIVLLAVLGIACWWRWGSEARRLLVGRSRLIVITEVVFAIALFVWALIRAYDPAIAGTEKPMEFAFINSILRTETFPPPDPWLSGFSISYYYFGYIMMAFLVKLSGVPSYMAFGLIGALLLSFTFTGVFSLGYNLATGLAGKARISPTGIDIKPFAVRRGPVVCGFLAGGMVTLMGNLEGLIEILNSRRMLSLEFVSWLSIRDLPPPYLSDTLMPSAHWWWWRASRVIGSFDPVTGVSSDYTINEFPLFSFMLGDVHPHVLSLPFVVMALALTLAALRSPAWAWREHWPHTILMALCFGALGFLNTWDLPLCLILYLAAYGVCRFSSTRLLNLSWLGQVLSYGAVLSALCILLFSPFYLTFSSQASGIGIPLEHTRLHQFAIFWAPFLLAILAYWGWHIWRWTKAGYRLPVGAVAGAAGAVQPEFALGPRSLSVIGSLALGAGAGCWALGIPVLGIMLPAAVLTAILIFRWLGVRTFTGSTRSSLRLAGESPNLASPEHCYLLMLALAGIVLLAACEVVFLRDLFGNRMNTVFKFYYQTWVLLGVASAGMLYFLAARWRAAPLGGRLAGLAISVMSIVFIGGASVYSFAAVISKSGGFAGTPSLNGVGASASQNPAEYAAIHWLQENTIGSAVILEATGGSYSQFGRVSVATGLPTLLGWDFHQRQWRGIGIDVEASSRKKAIESIYRGSPEAGSLLKQYGIGYIFVGSLERDAFWRQDGGAEQRLAALGDVVFRQGQVYVLRVRP